MLSAKQEEAFMSKRGIDFFEDWLQNNIQAESYAEEGKPDPRVPPLVDKCLFEAKEAGISKEEIEVDCGLISDRISQALEEATDDEIECQVSKSD
jgi:hypothetical protein